MFNGARFNAQRFNLPAVITDDFYFAASMSGDIGANAYMSANINTAVAASGAITGSSRVTPVIYSEVSGAVTINASAILKWDEVFQIQATAEIGANAEIGQNAYVAVSGAASMTASAWLSANIAAVIAAAVAFAAQAEISMNYDVLPIHMTAVFDAFTKTASFEVETINIGVTVPVGGTLYIDGDTLTVLLDGANAIDKHTGAWPEMSRNVYEMRFSSNNSIPLETRLVYTELYL